MCVSHCAQIGLFKSIFLENWTFENLQWTWKKATSRCSMDLRKIFSPFPFFTPFFPNGLQMEEMDVKWTSLDLENGLEQNFHLSTLGEILKIPTVKFFCFIGLFFTWEIWYITKKWRIFWILKFILRITKKVKFWLKWFWQFVLCNFFYLFRQLLI